MTSAVLEPRPGIDQSCFVEASAGTGKTRELVNRIVDVLAAGVPVDHIVAVTFTHAAAGEMKLRVREELDKRRQSERDETIRANLTLALQTLERAFIGTIHSFCAHLLRQRPVEARVDPLFSELAEQQAVRLFAQVFERWIQRRFAAPSPAIHRALARLAWTEERDAGDPLDHLRSAAWKLAEWRDQPTPWAKRPFDRDAKVRELVLEASKIQNLKPVRDFVAWTQRSRRSGVVDYDEIEATLLSLPFDKELSNLRYNPQRNPEWTALAGKLDDFRREADADLASHLRDELWEVVELYEAEKQRTGHLDFLDLLIFARDLLLHDGARRELQSRYQRVFVDEFQDTDPLQAEILLLLTANDAEERDWLRTKAAAGKLFVVGDPKQSIYRFRRADTNLYESIRDSLVSAGVARYPLQASRRSVDTIQHFVNAAFEPLLPDYLPLTGGEPAAVDQPSVMALPLPAPFGTRNISMKEIEACAPEATAAFVDWLVHKSNWTVRDPQTQERVPICENHICILFRRFTSRGVDLTLDYARALEARSLNHVLVGSKSFHHREEVGTVRAALRAIEWPDDALNVYATLRGALFAISDMALLKFKTDAGRISPFAQLPEAMDEELEPVRDALELLRNLHWRRNDRPLADTIGELLEHVRAHAVFAMRPGGERVLANVYRLTDLARNFEATGGTSFRAFVDFLEEEYESGQASEAPVLEAEANGVKIMTVHKAKGLEFPVVLLADLTCKLTRGEGDRFTDPARRLCAQKLSNWAPWELVDNRVEEAKQDRDEGLRVAYVAATRARDLLVVSAIGATEYDGWLEPLNSALYPSRDQWRFADPAPGCPPFAHQSVLRWPRDGEQDCVRPGLHRARGGAHEVVWFDPALLEKVSEKSRGIDNEKLLSAGGAAAAGGARRYEAWKQTREAAIETGAVPAHRVVRAIDAHPSPESANIPVEVISVGATIPRNGGRRFGALVHDILQHAQTIDDCAALAGVLGRGSSADELRAAGEAAAAIWSHTLMMQARASLRVCREFPVALQLEDGRLIEGIIDLAYSDGTSWTVVDYKTDHAAQSRYRAQIQFYALALRRATGLPARAILLEL